MSPSARREYVRHMQGRYGRVGHRSEKSRLLTEVSENMGWSCQLFGCKLSPGSMAFYAKKVSSAIK